MYYCYDYDYDYYYYYYYYYHYYFYLFIYLFQYLSRGIQFSRASLNGALIIKKGQKKKLC